MKRLIASLAAALALLALTVGVGSAPAAAAGTECKTAKLHRAITEGSVSIRIAWVEMYAEACTNGTDLVSTASWTDSGMTAPGIAAGFVFSFGHPHRTSFVNHGRTGAGAGYTATGTNKACATHWVHAFCSPTENFAVHVHITMANALYARPPGTNWWTINGRYFLFAYTWKCTNKACDVHFHK